MPELTRTCTFSGGCDRGVYAKGLCSTHYEQQRHGKQLTPIGSYAPQPAECTAEGCGRKPHSGGLCTGHRAQQLRGEELTPIGSRRPGRPSSRDETLCVVADCPDTHQDGLFCWVHWIRMESEIGDPQPGACRVLNCGVALHSHGFCKVHWGRITRYGRVSRVYAENTTESCAADGGRCTEPVHAKGYCHTHYQRVRRTGEAGSAELIPQAQRQLSEYAGETCKAEADGQRCDRPVKGRGWCAMHYHRWRRTGDPVGKWGIGPRQSQGYTTTDGYRMSPERRGGRPILEHRLVMEQVIGRPLYRHEEPHHKNGLRDDNSPENLELWVKWRQPNGQRLADLIDFVVTYYPAEVLAALASRQGSAALGEGSKKRE